ncbi:hypothetical protein F443_16234 [Phytophthora nicotianae P1569]|uniref:Uncharacterized protein n=1 Tax=Phytophthora nicotianae P1569 TaxID=1317065 RepID=V9EFE9_PHYNI|nr:hypothetical protein F443_16234 [Phytophthora nicotianae P1569]
MAAATDGGSSAAASPAPPYIQGAGATESPLSPSTHQLPTRSSSTRSRPARRTPPSSSSSSARVSPYPLRVRTPPQTALTPQASRGHRPRVSIDDSPDEGDQHFLRLVVEPIVKSTVGQRDATGRHLEIFPASGASFAAIMHKLWEKFSGNIKRHAVKTDATWSLETPTEASWSSVMQLKSKSRIASATKTPELRNKWIVDQKNNPVTLSIYEYGQAVSNARLLEEFSQVCIRPQNTNRSGAAAENAMRDMIEQLQEIWGNTYQASAVTWRMWANDIMRNLDRPSDGLVYEHLTRLTRSTHVALDTVNFALADNAELTRDWEAFGRRLECHKRPLEARKETLEGYFADVPLPSAAEVRDPLPTMQNIEDTEHQE